jgi:hypothetical protein
VAAAARAAFNAEPVAAPKPWHEQYADEYAWLVAKAPKSGFAASLLSGLTRYGSLTPRQLETVQRIVREDAERAAAPKPTGVSVDISKVITSLKAARSHILYPKLRLAGFVFSLAGANSANAGAVYVKSNGDVYLGKIIPTDTGARFLKSRDCSAETEAQVIASAQDPEAAAVAYGKEYGRCSCCGRTLTDPESIARGIGPICAEHYGW